MNIRLPNGERTSLPQHNTIDERLKEVYDLLKEFDSFFLDGAYTQNRLYFLDSLSNYLVWFKEESDNALDREVLSKNKIKKMNNYDEKNIPFSSLSKEDGIRIGVIDVDGIE